MAGRGTDILLGGGNPGMEDVLYEGLRPESRSRRNRRSRRPSRSFCRRSVRRPLDEAKRVCAQEQKEVLAAGGLPSSVPSVMNPAVSTISFAAAPTPGRPLVFTQFYLSLEDDLMRLFGGNRMDSIARLMEKPAPKTTCPFRRAWSRRRRERSAPGRIHAFRSP